MAYSDIRTELPLEEYARVMSIPGWLLNQCIHPARQIHGCYQPWFQNGYAYDPNRIVGRDELAQAIATAEQQASKFLGYWITPRWFCRDEVAWPRPKRGYQVQLPIIRAEWGMFIEGGQEAWELVDENVPVVYTDRDSDGCPDWATITANVAAAVSECEIVVTPHGYDPPNWSIRPLDVSVSGLIITITGYRWMFVKPTELLGVAEIELDDNPAFISGGLYDDGVDVYRRYNDPSSQAQIVWTGNYSNTCSGDTPCTESCQAACITPFNRRNGMVTVMPGSYSALTGLWSRADWLQQTYPMSVRLWYRAGYDDDACLDCSSMGARLKEAIVRLANVYLPEAPCGCDATKERWARDREEMAIDSIHVEMVQTAFGTTARGAMFAYNVLSNLNPLGKGG